MQFPNKFKIIWWGILVGLVSYLMSQRFSSFMSGVSNATDILIFVIWIALLVAPLFREVSFFGVSLKNEIDSLRDEIINLKNEIYNTQNVYVYPPPSPDSKLPEIKRVAKATLKEELRESPAESQLALETAIPDDISYLFAVRYNIENELRRITDLYWLSKDMESYPKTVIQKLQFLVHMKVIHGNLAFILKEMFSYCSAAIHGEEVSVNAMNWIRQDAPGIIEALKSIPDEDEADKD